MNKKSIIIGAGKHARVIIDILLGQELHIIGITDKNISKKTLIYDIPILGDDNEVLKYSPESVILVNGIGTDRDTTLRTTVFNTFKNQNYTFLTVIHPSTVISKRAVLHEGCEVLAGAIVNTESEIGANTIVNTESCSYSSRLRVEWECKHWKRQSYRYW